MPKVYAGSEATLKPPVMDASTYEAIGRLVRAFAEIEDIITLLISGLADTTQGTTLVMLGRSAMRARIGIAAYLASMKSEKQAELHKAIFNAAFDEALECRNAVAHGTFMGITDDDGMAFLTQKLEEPVIGSPTQQVIVYGPRTIPMHAQNAEKLVLELERHLGLSALRQRHLLRALGASRKAQKRARPKSEH